MPGTKNKSTDYLSQLEKLTDILEHTDPGSSFDLEELYEESELQSNFRKIYGEPRKATVRIGEKERTLRIYPVMPKRWYFTLDYAAQGLLCEDAQKLLDVELAAKGLTRKEMEKLDHDAWDRIGKADGLPDIIPPPPKAVDLAKPSKHPICLDKSLLTFTDKNLDYICTNYQRDDCGFRPPRLDGVAGTCKTQVNTLISQILRVPLVKVAGEKSDPMTVQMKFGRSNAQLVTNPTETAKTLASWGAISSRKAERELFRKLAERGSYPRLTDEDYQGIAQLEGLRAGEPYSAPNEYAFAKQFGGYLFLDEINNFDPSIQTILNSELENRAPRVVHDDLNYRVRVHPNYIVAAAQNPASLMYEKRDPLSFDLASRMNVIPEVPAPTAEETSDHLFFKCTGIQPKVTVNGVTKRFSYGDIGLEAQTYKGYPIIRDVDPEILKALTDKVAKLHVSVYKASEQGVLSRMHQCEPTKDAEMQVSEPNAFSKRNIDDFCSSLHAQLLRSLQHKKGKQASQQERNKALVSAISHALHVTYYSPNDFSRAVEMEDDNKRKRNDYTSAASFVEKTMDILGLSTVKLEEMFAGPIQDQDLACLHGAIQAFPGSPKKTILRGAAELMRGLQEYDRPCSMHILEDVALLVDKELGKDMFLLKYGEAYHLNRMEELADQLSLDKDTSYIFHQQIGGKEHTQCMTHNGTNWKAVKLSESPMDVGWVHHIRTRDPKKYPGKDKIEPLRIRCLGVQLVGARMVKGDILDDSVDHLTPVTKWAKGPSAVVDTPEINPNESTLDLA